MPLTACQFGFGYDKEQFITELRAEGAKVDYTAMMAPNFWLGTGSTTLANDKRVHVYESSDVKTSREMAENISPDGETITVPYDEVDGLSHTMLREYLHWEGAPHLYQRGRLIVVYVGDDPELMDTMEDILGEQFAGKSSMLAPDSTIYTAP